MILDGLPPPSTTARGDMDMISAVWASSASADLTGGNYYFPVRRRPAQPKDIVLNHWCENAWKMLAVRPHRREMSELTLRLSGEESVKSVRTQVPDSNR